MTQAEREAWGIVPGYEDVFGGWTDTPDDTARSLIVAMGGDPDDPTSRPPEPWNVWVVRRGERPDLMGPVLLRLEDGSEQHVAGSLPADLPLGYHDLHPIEHGDPREEPTRLIVSPGLAAPPPAQPAWGIAAQLYGVRSRASWGIGDLADLRELGALVRSLGATTVLVNPLDAVSPSSPRETSPYYPSSRRFRDPIYLSIEDIPGIASTPGVAALAATAHRLNAEPTIDRDAVYDLKVRAAERLWDHRHGRADEPGFARFLREQGVPLQTFATFCVLAEQHGGGWRSWPVELRDPSNRAVARFAREHETRVRFHAWLQWLLDEQLRRAGRTVDLLRDLPVGFDPGGADAWAWNDLLAQGVSIGAPPDQLGPDGQSWGLPPFVPWKLRAAGYRPFVQTLRSAFRHAAGLRIDHVLGLFRQFWVPPRGSAAEGTYVSMPTRELLDVLALESHRAGAFVVGEDLGTVPAGVREELAERRMLRYQVLLFEQDDPTDWDELALASATTHDLPTLAGLWTGADASELRALGRQPDDDWEQQVRARLHTTGHATATASGEQAAAAAHRLLSRARARLVVAQLEDATGVMHRPNVPGTGRDERANWSRALPVPLEELADHPGVRATAEAFRSRA